ncbi:MAG: hypothetical protein ACRYG4_00530 [Janthinobacterium lividum]
MNLTIASAKVGVAVRTDGIYELVIHRPNCGVIRIDTDPQAAWALCGHLQIPITAEGPLP